MSIFKDKVLLITGGTGSFGNAVLRRFLASDIREIRIFSRDEKKQDDMRHGLQAQHPEQAGKGDYSSLLRLRFINKKLKRLLSMSYVNVISSPDLNIGCRQKMNTLYLIIQPQIFLLARAIKQASTIR